MRSVVPDMKARGADRSYGQTGIQTYAGAEAGLIGFTRQIARELGPFGITANSVAPECVLSNPTSVKQWEHLGEARQQRFFDALAIQRLCWPSDVAHAVLFFASEHSPHITGRTLNVDGGR